MDINEIEYELALLTSDAEAIDLLSLEIREETMPNDRANIKAHAIMSLSKHQITSLEKILKWLYEIKNQIQKTE